MSLIAADLSEHPSSPLVCSQTLLILVLSKTQPPLWFLKLCLEFRDLFLHVVEVTDGPRAARYFFSVV